MASRKTVNQIEQLEAIALELNKKNNELQALAINLYEELVACIEDSVVIAEMIAKSNNPAIVDDLRKIVKETVSEIQKIETRIRNQ